jgi:hypothetical protein
MTKYASLLFAPEKFHEIGPFRFPVYEDLVPGEAKGIEEYGRRQSRSTFFSIKLAQRIAKDRGITTAEAVEMLSNTAESNQEVLFDYVTELEELQNNALSAVEQQVAYVTLFIKYRGEIKLPNSSEWQRVADWTEADTEAVPTKIVDEVFRFIMWERDGWPTTEGKSEAEDTPKRSSPQKSS